MTRRHWVVFLLDKQELRALVLASGAHEAARGTPSKRKANTFFAPKKKKKKKETTVKAKAKAKSPKAQENRDSVATIELAAASASAPAEGEMDRLTQRPVFAPAKLSHCAGVRAGADVWTCPQCGYKHHFQDPSSSRRSDLLSHCPKCKHPGPALYRCVCVCVCVV